MHLVKLILGAEVKRAAGRDGASDPLGSEPFVERGRRGELQGQKRLARSAVATEDCDRVGRDHVGHMPFARRYVLPMEAGGDDRIEPDDLARLRIDRRPLAGMGKAARHLCPKRRRLLGSLRRKLARLLETATEA